MTVIEPGLYVRVGFAEGPLADAALSRVARAAQLGGQLDTTPLSAMVREHVVLVRGTTRAWGRLAPQIHPAPKSSTHPGRVHVVQGATAHPAQVLLMTDTEAADWASGAQTGTP
ncbi:hypothetical protein [Streptomyces albidoflavus]|uniref:hypothetical protein n=1 Tax=Streptomyces albidoflavus TaxID=1886 RepID=UPI00101E6780|nr:hypothetical protein [Streptomyces albidoflavus]RZD89290.1 hypothetical protein C0Q60_03500 [Streptomyces albidoflavus]RZE04949.1 hypothetical protein C0Q62_03415 [Streptomyces albidoflavus]